MSWILEFGKKTRPVVLLTRTYKTSVSRRKILYTSPYLNDIFTFGPVSEKYKVIDSSTPTFVTMTVIDWVDLFTRKIYTDILDESLKFCIQKKGLKIHAYVYMTNHIHLIISSDRIELNEIVRDFKKFTSRQLVDTIQGTHESRRKWLLSKFSFEAKRIGRATNYKVWQDGFHPIILNTNRKLQNRVEYIHYNPIHAGFVNHERDWANSSYLAYEEEKPMLNFKVEPLY